MDVAIFLLFTFQGIETAIFGPTLLDMQYIYQTQIKNICIIPMLKAIGSVIGASLSGILLDKLPKFRYWILFSCSCLLGICTALLPHMTYLWAFFVISTFSGINSGALHSGGNVLCLDTWKDDSGPYLHSIHFSFAVNIMNKNSNVSRFSAGHINILVRSL